MSSIPYMPLYIADYMADAAHLSTLEHGAYLLLIMTYWQRGKALPNSDERLANVARLSSEQWEQVKPVLAEFFVDADGSWHHKRIDAELSRFRDKSAKASAAGKASAQRRHSGRSTPVEHPPSHTDTDTSKKVSPLPPSDRERLVYDLPDDWLKECLEEMRWLEKVARDVWKNFGAHYRGMAGRGGFRTLEEWRAAWMTWCRKENINTGGLNGNSSRGAAAGGDTAAGGRGNKTERAKAAVLRAATAGGYAPGGSEGEAGTGNNSVSVFPEPETVRQGTGST